MFKEQTAGDTGNRSAVRIKICGLTRPRDIEAANELKPDYIGFVFAKKSRRYVTPEQAKSLRALLSGEICVVGVFTEKELDDIQPLLEDGVIDIAQVHGASGIPGASGSGSYWQAFRIDTAEDIDRANASEADMVLLDHGAGGTGERFDWSLLDGMRRPFMLAGGLDPENVHEALAAAAENDMLYGLDVSSGLETDHRKDPEKMRRFCEAVRGRQYTG